MDPAIRISFGLALLVFTIGSTSSCSSNGKTTGSQTNASCEVSSSVSCDSSGEGDAGSRMPDAGKHDGGNATADGGSTAAVDAGEPETHPCKKCPSGQCLDDGTCVECAIGLPCEDPALTCELTSHTCVECLPTADECARGSYCDVTFVCVPGCKDGNSCGGGVCNSNHDCASCLDDTECADGRVCGTFECGPACSGADDPICVNGTQCCASQCVNTTRDIEHCLGCDIACDASEFCGSAGCTEVAIANLCKNNSAALVLNGFSEDEAASALLRSELEGSCAPAPEMRSVSQTDDAVLNPLTGRPVAGSNDLLVTLGSAYGNHLVRYLELERIAPVYQLNLPGPPEAFEFRRSSDDAVLLHAPLAKEVQTQGHFLLQMVRDPATGTLVLSTYGYWAEGTGAGAWFLSHRVLPSLSTYTKTWYIYKWTSGNANLKPDDGDTFTLVDSGT